MDKFSSKERLQYEPKANHKKWHSMLLGLPLLLLTNFGHLYAGWGIIPMVTDSYFLAGVVVLMSLMLVSEIPLFSLKFKTFAWSGNKVRYTFFIVCLLLIAFLLVWSIPLIVILYLIFSIILNNSKKKEHEIQS